MRLKHIHRLRVLLRVGFFTSVLLQEGFSTESHFASTHASALRVFIAFRLKHFITHCCLLRYKTNKPWISSAASSGFWQLLFQVTEEKDAHFWLFNVDLIWWTHIMLLSAASRGVTVTQPEVLTVSEGRDATIECKTEPGIFSWG